MMDNNKQNKIISYIAVIKQDHNGIFSIKVPDVLKTSINGINLNDVIEQTKDAVVDTLKNLKTYPKNSLDVGEMSMDKNTQITMITFDMNQYSTDKDKVVRKNVSVPEYLIDMGKKNGVNFSQMLTDSLKDMFNLDNEKNIKSNEYWKGYLEGKIDLNKSLIEQEMNRIATLREKMLAVNVSDSSEFSIKVSFSEQRISKLTKEINEWKNELISGKFKGYY